MEIRIDLEMIEFRNFALYLFYHTGAGGCNCLMIKIKFETRYCRHRFSSLFILDIAIVVEYIIKHIHLQRKRSMQ